MRRLLTYALSLIGALTITSYAEAQVWQPNTQDSLAIASAEWQVSHPSKGLTLKQLQTTLFDSKQSISLVEISLRHYSLHIAGNAGMRRTSQQAQQHSAAAAINGTYYNMRQGNSVCFYMENGVAIDSTAHSEFAARVNGAVVLRRRKVQLAPWDYETERNFKGRGKDVLASGPLLVQRGRIQRLESLRQIIHQHASPS